MLSPIAVSAYMVLKKERRFLFRKQIAEGINYTEKRGISKWLNPALKQLVKAGLVVMGPDRTYAVTDGKIYSTERGRG